MKDHLFQLVQAADPLQGRNILREYLQARILDASTARGGDGAAGVSRGD